MDENSGRQQDSFKPVLDEFKVLIRMKMYSEKKRAESVNRKC